jgi:hypothetical protein
MFIFQNIMKIKLHWNFYFWVKLEQKWSNFFKFKILNEVKDPNELILFQNKKVYLLLVLFIKIINKQNK